VRLLGTPAPSAKGLSAARSYCTRRAGPVRYNGKAGGVHPKVLRQAVRLGLVGSNPLEGLEVPRYRPVLSRLSFQS